MLTLSVFAVLLLLLLTPTAKRWSGPNLPGMRFQQVVPQELLGRTRRLHQQGLNCCRGGYLPVGWCDPATGNEYRGYKTTGTETKEIWNEEIISVSAAPLS
jgi:hypothetical protein